jgi:hypothetical protein
MNIQEIAAAHSAAAQEAGEPDFFDRINAEDYLIIERSHSLEDLNGEWQPIAEEVYKLQYKHTAFKSPHRRAFYYFFPHHPQEIFDLSDAQDFVFNNQLF